jgi:hypothetical protein
VNFCLNRSLTILISLRGQIQRVGGRHCGAKASAAAFSLATPKRQICGQSLPNLAGLFPRTNGVCRSIPRREPEPELGLGVVIAIGGRRNRAAAPNRNK